MEARKTAKDYDSLEEKGADIELSPKNYAAAIGAELSLVECAQFNKDNTYPHSSRFVFDKL